LDGIGMMVSYGITGSMVAAVASPVLVRGLVDGLGAQVMQRMGLETGLQMGTSLIFNGDLSGVDLADIGMAGLFSKMAFVGQAFIDFKSKEGLKTSFGLGMDKTIWDTSMDFAVGGFNSGYSKLLESSEINKNVVSTITIFNGGLRTVVSEAATPIN